MSFDTVSEPLERRPPVREVESSISDRVTPMTYETTDTCHFLAEVFNIIWIKQGMINSCLGVGTYALGYFPIHCDVYIYI